MSAIVLENESFVLRLGEDCTAQSLVCRATGEECIMPGEEAPLFTVTEDRPYNNEIKLAHPNKRTTFRANRVRMEGDKLIVGFELIAFEAVVGLKIAPRYMAFVLEDFRLDAHQFEWLYMAPPPVSEFRLLQLPVRERKNFGEWLNVTWDEKTAVNVLSTSPYTRIDAEKRRGHRILTADVLRDIRLKGCGAALIAEPTDSFLDAIGDVERDFGLPRGADSRRGEKINASAYWAYEVLPENVDEHIARARQGGFSMMLMYYTSFVKEPEPYALSGDYDIRDEYGGSVEGIRAMLDRIKAAGIIPGFHFLHSHIGLRSRYLTPVADYRVNLTRKFTLSRPLDAEATTVFVEEDPTGTMVHPACRVLRFGGELIFFEGFSASYPYCFTGCTRGWNDTHAYTHEVGTAGGILDISEYGATSAYVNQKTSLQDEVGAKLARIYDAGFEFVYFDGSEGVDPPFEINVPLAQYRVFRQFGKEPLYCEGAAKAHFSWHMMGGGNAFDIFPTDVFKEKIAQYPAEEAPRMAMDFTRLNFGWWAYYMDTMPDIYEYGTSRAAAWDCPVTVQVNLEIFRKNPRTADNLEVMRRWEDIRARKLLTPEMKESLRDLAQEHILLLNGEGGYELTPYDKVAGAAGGDRRVSAFIFGRHGEAWAVLWHTEGEGDLFLPADPAALSYRAEADGEELPVTAAEGGAVIALAGRRYLKTALSREELAAALEKACLQ